MPEKPNNSFEQGLYYGEWLGGILFKLMQSTAEMVLVYVEPLWDKLLQPNNGNPVDYDSDFDDRLPGL